MKTIKLTSKELSTVEGGCYCSAYKLGRRIRAWLNNDDPLQPFPW